MPGDGDPGPANAPAAPSLTAGTTPPLTTAEVLAGVNDVNFRIGQLTGRMVEAASQLFALATVLVEKGVLTPGEIEAARTNLLEQFHDDAIRAGLTVELAAPDDKYALHDLPVIDCGARLHLCGAACCRLRFALSEQDIAERVVQWTLAQPYLNRQREDGYCVHCDAGSNGCTVYEHRPSSCRQFDCRNDTRIWLDFEQRVINPDLRPPNQ